LPNSKLAEVRAKLEELEKEFWGAKEAFLNKYSSLRQSASLAWRRMAEKLVNDPDRLVATIEASFPFPDKMERFYSFDLQLFQISAPKHLAAELISAGDQQARIAGRQKASEAAAHKIRSDMEGFVSDCVSSLREQTAQIPTDRVAVMDNKIRVGSQDPDAYDLLVLPGSTNRVHVETANQSGGIEERCCSIYHVRHYNGCVVSKNGRDVAVYSAIPVL
jgi:hypothetical protein